ncbi:TetR/AcrR family transcriptional regulator [Williamsia sp. 1135]|uniref:TetR/AcrR family transcriptional regulator n=1 Tax=Williamsia sp. 1135 TaxID=1889262 RepID=UPI000A0F8444|nr:TetR/AcrR family transcriptional regulator [Williamsia sp. 1135]ORM29113.1 TetR family transcriptional regulator [Williamsia sp. 1135]
MTEPGTTRPGGRTAAVRASVLRAAGDVMAASGLSGLDLTDVAVRAGVGKTTVYRRWGSAANLVTDLLSEMAAESSPRSDTGSLSGDLHANAALVYRTLSDERQGPLFKAMIAAATCDPVTASALEHFYDTRVAEWAPCVTDAISRGDAPEGTNSESAIRQVSAPLYYQFLTTTKRLTPADAERAADAALAAIAAGLFRN